MSNTEDRIVYINPADPAVLLQNLQSSDFARFLYSGLSDILPKDLSLTVDKVMTNGDYHDVILGFSDPQNVEYGLRVLFSVRDGGEQINETTVLTCDLLPYAYKGTLMFGSVRIEGILKDLAEDFVYQITHLRLFSQGVSPTNLGTRPFFKRSQPVSCFLLNEDEK